ncbi:MAG TPA: putative baseplate assembly protein, partial [Roseiflexaceae bacterium]|nr:putative baseplate assembly protein [Roseiflexaceae bacterium]
STCRVRLVVAPDRPPAPLGFDPLLAAVEFSFKVGCPSEFDCVVPHECTPQELPAPHIDYLARDYASFRRLMLDRMALTLPAWHERNPADQMVALVEVLAYAADQLSYQQDAAATEAYLGTARRRVSLRRHARLLDYPLGEGRNARAWVVLEVQAAADGALLPGPDPQADRPGTLLLTKTRLAAGSITTADIEQIAEERPTAFETMHDLRLYAAHNQIVLYTWGDEQCCLPQGATRATLRNTANRLQQLAAGDCLLFEEVRGAASGRTADADPAHRHVVRLTSVRFTEDPLFADDPDDPTNPLGPRLQIAEITWDVADALPFPLCLDLVEDDDIPGHKQPVSVARGNLVLADHGATIVEQLPAVGDTQRYRPWLSLAPLSRQGRVAGRRGRMQLFDAAAAATSALHAADGQDLPAIRLRQDGPTGPMWLPQPDLLGSSRFARTFVVETEADGRTFLRFGDGRYGRRPAGALLAIYRIGNGTAGNIGADALAHVVGISGVSSVRNPLAASGGREPEPSEQVRLYAPEAFRVQRRAITEADYAAVADQQSQVGRAVATRRWTGSWHTMYLSIDRQQGHVVDAPFIADLRRHVEPFRLMGHDLEVDLPIFVPLEIVMTVCVKSGYLRSAVRQALLAFFSNRMLPGNRRGFFHPDNFTFGQPVYLSRIIAGVMATPGVQWVDVDDTPPKPNRFRRLGRPAHAELAAGEITMGRREVARLDNDPNAPENGRIDFLMEGGA